MTVKQSDTVVGHINKSTFIVVHQAGEHEVEQLLQVEGFQTTQDPVLQNLLGGFTKVIFVVASCLYSSSTVTQCPYLLPVIDRGQIYELLWVPPSSQIVLGCRLLKLKILN